MTRPLLAAALLAALAGIAPAWGDSVCPDNAQGFERLKVADMQIAYRWEPVELKVGQFFAAEVVDCSTPGFPVDRIRIDATMPAHGHGMSYRPTAERIAPGHHRFTGLMLHMPGTWRFTFTVFRADVGIQLTHDVVLKQ
jgi:hypothetical protein